MQISKRSIGVNFINDVAEVLVWAPKAIDVKLIIGALHQKIEMQKTDFGYFFLQTDLLKPNNDYQFELNIDGNLLQRADPASLSQPFGVHKPSRALNLKNFTFTDDDWKGLELKDFIIYELHVGTFSKSSDFEGILNHLDHLVDLGITAIELMPVASFPGNRNWGYDGVFPFSVHQSYGGAEQLQRLVNACHAKGLAVILDVVYNHFGPEGNYLEDFAPYLTGNYQTPWGKAINFDSEGADGVRNYFIENVLMWFRDFHIDALRLDAVHAIKDFSAKHFLSEVKDHVNLLNQTSNLKHLLIIESDLNDPKYIKPIEIGGLGMDSQWNDEFHHSLRVAVGEKPRGYYADFNGLLHLAKSFTDAYVYDGQYSPHRKRKFGAKADALHGENFIGFSQNHDQVGNRMLGERSSALYASETLKLLFAATIVSPYIPMLFMGEEWATTQPFLYFISHGDENLVEAVREGRTKEFSAFHEGNPPDPQALSTFENSKLNWNELHNSKHFAIFKFYQALIKLRKSNAVLAGLNREKLSVSVSSSTQCLTITRWNENETLQCYLNFSSALQEVYLPSSTYQILIDSSATAFGGPGSLITSANQQSVQINPSSILIFSKSNV